MIQAKPISSLSFSIERDERSLLPRLRRGSPLPRWRVETKKNVKKCDRGKVEWEIEENVFRGEGRKVRESGFCVRNRRECSKKHGV